MPRNWTLATRLLLLPEASAELGRAKVLMRRRQWSSLFHCDRETVSDWLDSRAIGRHHFLTDGVARDMAAAVAVEILR